MQMNLLPKSHRQLWGDPFPMGGEWDAGIASMASPDDHGGRWTIRREPDQFVEIFHSFQDKSEVVLGTFEPTDEGEIEAKIAALADRECDRRTP
jgi:hypothetical protein